LPKAARIGSKARQDIETVMIIDTAPAPTQAPTALTVAPQAAVTPIETNSLAALAGRIRAEHEAVATFVKQSLARAMAAGDLLLEAKAQLKKLKKHGEWTSWVEKNCLIPERTVRLYMQLSKNRKAIEAKTATVADLTVRGAVELISVKKSDTPAKVKETVPASVSTQPKKKSSSVDLGSGLNSLQWSDAVSERQIKFIDAVGLRQIYDAATLEQKSSLINHINAEQDAREAARAVPEATSGITFDADRIERVKEGIRFAWLPVKPTTDDVDAIRRFGIAMGKATLQALKSLLAEHELTLADITKGEPA
jgi:hypothetical protein